VSVLDDASTIEKPSLIVALRLIPCRLRSPAASF
jgi:hypothetical protein